MSIHLRVEGHSNLVRDKRTGAILNSNSGEMARARKLRETKIKEAEVIQGLTQEVDSLKSDINQIKELLFRLVEDKNEHR